ncbi:MAG TPA: MarR family winged helix-turn-helix transcriptional regulator [Polyangia bacterium]
MSTSPQRVLDSIRRIVRLLREGSRASEDAVGLSAAQLFVLQKLDPDTPLSLNELAARTLTHQSSVSVVVSRLVERGLVLRRPAADDARRLELLPTRRGLALRDRGPAPSQERVIAAVAKLTDKQQRELADHLERLVRALGVDERAAPMLLFDEPTAQARPRRTRKRANTRRA